MKRKKLIVFYLILIIIMLILTFVYFENKLIITKYQDGEYLQAQAQMLTNITWQSSYVSNYNYGNILYQNGEYDKAIEEYKKALRTVTSTEKECKIRINYALAICKMVQLDESDEESIKEAIETYQSAIQILTEDGCNNHNQDAKKLKKDIEEEIERLKNLQKKPQDNTNQDEKEETGQSQAINEEDIEEKMKDIKEGAIKEQNDLENKSKNYNKNHVWNEKNW